LKQNDPTFLNAIYRIDDADETFPDEIVLETVDGTLKSMFKARVRYGMNQIEAGQIEAED
jgi:hypothetical protein